MSAARKLALIIRSHPSIYKILCTSNTTGIKYVSALLIQPLAKYNFVENNSVNSYMGKEFGHQGVLGLVEKFNMFVMGGASSIA